MQKDLIDSVTEEIETDWIDFADFLFVFRETTGSPDDPVREGGKAAARLVREGTLVAGWITDAGFAPWAGSAEESARRIEEATARYLTDGTTPGLSDVCYFDLPSHAAKWADPIE